jgi:hypothetical protein
MSAVPDFGARSKSILSARGLPIGRHRTRKHNFVRKHGVAYQDMVELRGIVIIA